MTARNRELVNLGLVGLLTAAGFASVYIAALGASSRPPRSPTRRSSSPSSSIAHVVLRVAAPARRPVPAPARRAPVRARDHRALPDRARAGLPAGSLGRRRRRPSSPASSSSCATTASWTTSSTSSASRRSCSSSCRRCPCIGRTINGATLWVDFGGPLVFQPGELAKVLLRRSSWPATCATTARCSPTAPRARAGLPSPKHLGPAAPHLGRRDARALPDPRPGRRRSSTSRSSSSCSTRRPRAGRSSPPGSPSSSRAPSPSTR